MKARPHRDPHTSDHSRGGRFDFGSACSDWFSGTARRDRDLRIRERIRRDLVKEHFEPVSAQAPTAATPLYARLIKRLRLD